jgi:hypothetical protein
MAKNESTDKKEEQKRWIGGISDYLKEGSNFQVTSQFYFGRSVDFRNDPQAITLLPGALKESGGTVTDLLKWADIVPTSLTVFLYGDSGNLYQRTSTPSWSKIGQVPASHGNGLSYFSGDDYVYLTSDSSIARYGPTANSPVFTPNFLQAQGGVPTNTASLLLASASSMYGSAADSASLSVTGDLTLETFFKCNTLPAVGSSMTLIGKWDESGATRSYKLDLYGVSGYFGNGQDGALTVSVNTTEAPIDSACTGTSGTQALTATNASFAQGQVILIHQSQGTGAGKWERNTINGYTTGTITTGTPLVNSYTSGAQVRVLKQYTNVTVNTGITYTAKAWNGTVGGILAFLASGTVTVTGNIVADGGAGSQALNGQTTGGGSGGGFRGGNAVATDSPNQGYTGEGTAGASVAQTTANGNGGGGAYINGPNNGSGGGGGNGTVGQIGQASKDVGNDSDTWIAGAAGASAGSADLTTMMFGGGGGGGVNRTNTCGGGGAGGGIIFITATTLTVTGAITSNGGAGAYDGNTGSQKHAGGGGAGGSILLKAQTATLGSSLITANAGAGGGIYSQGGGGAGSVGRIHLDYYTSYTGTTTPTLDYAQDNTLVTTNTTQARLGISNDGTAYEYLSMNLSSLTTGVWNRLSVSWASASSLATFYWNAVSLGTFTGTKTAIHDNASLLYVGANKNATVVTNYFDGLLNDMRIWANVQTATQIFNNYLIQISPSLGGLNAYYKYNSAYTDATANTNTLTSHGSPTFSTDVPFAGATTRLDIDVAVALTGQTYTLLTAIAENSADMLPFTPVNDPQASVGFFVDTKGTGDWTVTVHDQQNRVIATKTILNASIPASGFVEFIFANPWRLVFKQSYHMHLTVSTGTSKVVTGTTANFSTAEYTTYFGFLVPDTQFHPVTQFQYQPLGGSLTGAEIIGNERYLAVWDGANYLPNFITLTPGWKVRCFAQWRQYLAIGVWKGGNIYDLSHGRIYFWTGYQPAYDFFIDVPEGQINALFGVDSDLYMFAGYRGQLLDYKGGYFYNTGNSESNKIKKMPLLESNTYTEVFPGALTMWRGLLHFGLYANSNSTTSQRGAYSYGTLNPFYPEALSFDYPISTGNRGSTVTIGLVYPVGQNLLIGWQDGSGYGCDVVNFNNPPADNGEIQLFLNDGGKMWHDDDNLAIKAVYSPLRTGESITPEYALDRQSFNQLTTVSTVGSRNTKQLIANGRSCEVQIGVTMTQTNGTSPTLLGLTLDQDPLESEEAL